MNALLGVSLAAANGVSTAALIAVGLAALAAVIAFVAARAKKSAASAPAVEREPAPRPETIELPSAQRGLTESPLGGGSSQPVAAPLSAADEEAAAARAAREARAKEEVAAKEAALAAAREQLSKATISAEREAAEATVARLVRDVESARKKVEYEGQKLSAFEERARRAAEAEAKLAALRAEQEAHARAAAEAKAAEAASRQKLVDQEKGRTLSEGLSKTRGGFVARLNALFGTGRQLDEDALAELESILFSADIGVHTATALLETVREKLKRRELSDITKIKGALRTEIERILALGAAPGASLHGVLPELPAGMSGPQVVMVVGVNGVGKTTTIGKLASKLAQNGKKVLLGAGDTYRAAAGEQLDVWAERASVPIVRGKDGSDPGAVLFDAVAKGKADGFDVVLCDTAGRLHTKAGLMDELKRMKRTLEKASAGAPHEVLLVVDATNGQNAIAQARQFHEALGVTGFVLTKLDGTAKGGVIIGICDELKIPVRYVGVGEKAADLKPFDPHEFVSALFDD